MLAHILRHRSKLLGKFFRTHCIHQIFSFPWSLVPIDGKWPDFTSHIMKISKNGSIREYTRKMKHSSDMVSVCFHLPASILWIKHNLAFVYNNLIYFLKKQRFIFKAILFFILTNNYKCFLILYNVDVKYSGDIKTSFTSFQTTTRNTVEPLTTFSLIY